jgi:hypothetical protein
MTDVFKSATKIVFILIALSTCVGFFLDKITNEQFIGVVMMVFAFYYVTKSVSTETSSPKVI